MAIHTCFRRFLLASLFWGSWLGANAQTPDQFFTVKSFTVSANLTQPVHTGLILGFNDFVYIEAQGKISVGAWYGETYAVGMESSTKNNYNKYASFQHGALIWQIGPGSGVCHKLFRINDNFVHNYFMVSKTHMVINDGNYNYVPGDYFLSQSTGELVFDINDSETGNNRGLYSVKVLVIKEYYHINRNQFNRCPKTEPADGKKDSRGNGWFRELPNSWVNHGFNNSYRGLGIYSGCQCVYDQGTILIGDAADTRNNQGSFDFGFWLKKGALDDDEAKHLHLILDMLPHECWVERYGGNTARMRYSPTKTF